MPENPAVARKYSLSEIDRMRFALRGIVIQPNVPYYGVEKNAEIEDMLRTYMSNGTDPEELEAAAAELWRSRLGRS